MGRARERFESLSRRGREWADRQEPASATGIAIGGWRRYQSVDGPLQSLLLTAYVVIAVLRALLWAPRRRRRRATRSSRGSRLVTHGLVSRRDLLPGAVITSVGLVGIMVLSSYEMERWVDFYARDYGGFGVVMAVFFWVGFSSAVIVSSASLGPALAELGRTRHTVAATTGRSGSA